MNRSEKIQRLADIFVGCGITEGMSKVLSRQVLDELFPPLDPIEYDEVHKSRAYIPLPGGFEVQTKGEGSTFRICDDKNEQMPITDSRYGYEVKGQVITRLEINTNWIAMFEDEIRRNSKGIYEHMQLIAFHDPKRKDATLTDIVAALQSIGVSSEVAKAAKICKTPAPETKYFKYKNFIELTIDVPREGVIEFLKAFKAWHIHYGEFVVYKGRSVVGKYYHIDDAVNSAVKAGAHVWKRECVTEDEVRSAIDWAMRGLGFYEWKPIYLMRNS